MHIFSRTRTMNPAKTRAALAWAAEMTERTRSLAGIDVMLSYGALGFPSGTLMWSTRMDSVAQLDQVMSDVMANDEYLEASERGAELFLAPSEDQLFEVVAATNVGDPKPFNNVVRGEIADGKILDAMNWGAEVSQYVGELLGRPSIFGRTEWGRFGTVGWIVGFDDAADVEAGMAKLGTDPGYMQRIEGAAGFFQEGVTQFGLIKQLS